MSIQVTSVYTNTKEHNTKFRTGHGQSFLITNLQSGKKILFDIGTKGEDVLFNMNLLGIHPDEIDLIVFSHGHYDHTRGLESFLKVRKKEITIIGHPNIIEPKKVKFKKWFFNVKIDIGFPKLKSSLKKKIKFLFQTEFYAITDNIFLSGEIITRNEKDGTEDRLIHYNGKKWERDPLVDDQSLIIETDKGLVIICGCCHAGLLNTLKHISQTFENKNIFAVIGGTHMLKFNENELEHISKVLVEKYKKPILYLNHCTGNFAFDYLQQKLGKETVKPFHTGYNLFF